MRHRRPRRPARTRRVQGARADDPRPAPSRTGRRGVPPGGKGRGAPLPRAGHGGGNRRSPPARDRPRGDARRPGSSPAVHPGSDLRRPRPHGHDGRPSLDHLQRRDLQLPRAPRRAARARSRLRHRLRHGGAAGRLRGMGRGRAAPAQRHVRLRALRRAGSLRALRAGPLRGQALPLLGGRGAVRVRLRDQGAGGASARSLPPGRGRGLGLPGGGRARRVRSDVLHGHPVAARRTPRSRARGRRGGGPALVQPPGAGPRVRPSPRSCAPCSRTPCGCACAATSAWARV